MNAQHSGNTNDDNSNAHPNGVEHKPTDDSTSPWLVVAGGGTAGHLLPGIAVADALRNGGLRHSDIHFIGAERGIEAKIVPEAGYGITLLPGRGIQRKLTLENLRSAWGLIQAFLRATRLIRKQRPAAVLALGGFASAAGAFGAVINRVPLVIAEQNAKAGAVNRLIGRFAVTTAASFPNTDLPKTVVTGNPVRPEIYEAATSGDSASARTTLDLPTDRVVILSFAGSLGSRRINTAIYGLVHDWQDNPNVAIYHVIGSRDWDDRDESGVNETDTTRLWYRQVQYEDQMARALLASDVVVCRAGGTTIAELTALGKPAVLVPLPIATRDHQRANAQALVDNGGAIMVLDADATTERIKAELEPLVTNGDDSAQRRESMANKAKALGNINAAHDVADLIQKDASRPAPQER